ncbi:response regulator transcription factor [Wenzhouxiangella limi]|uniref:Response regulator transcription factor n=1 Tax=Wenzhouxiangella limi TaxID=2707351 RepID=A0A845V0W0_9GAMM|nr:response regulator transcription factor [Wenzhouxiangella limi]NDY95850.1 response regulator transcription factor [Wenzhouxiangella limi]
MSLRIALADDQALVREGLKALLRDLDGIEVVAEAEGGEELLAQIETTSPDLVLSDIRMPGVDGIELTRRLGEVRPDLPVILLTTFDDAELTLKAAEAGARGFLLKDVSPEELEDVIRRVAGGETVLQPVTSRVVRARYAYSDDRVPVEGFSPREIEILRLLAGGYSNREIANTIFLAEGTVKNYVSEILEKLETRDRTRAVLKAITLRII